MQAMSPSLNRQLQNGPFSSLQYFENTARY